MKKEREKLIIKKNNTRKIYIPIYLMVIILLITLAYFQFSEKTINPFATKLVLAFVTASLLAAEIHRIGNKYEITENSLVHTQGYLTKKARRLDFGAISDFYVIQNIWQRLLFYGNIEVRLFSGESNVNIKSINQPFEFVRILENKIKGAGGRYR